jgi:hypothetical protein
MNIYIDLDTLTLIQSPTDRRTVSRLDIKRGDHSPFTIRFLRAGLPVRLGASTVLTFAAKENGKFDAAAVSLFDDFAQSAIPTAPAPDSDPHWTGAPSFNTVELNALFDIDADPDNDPPFVDIMAEFTWQATGDAGPTTSRTFGIRVLNDVFRGDEDTPLALPTPEQWLSAQTSPILEALQGAENDPSRIGLEYLPGSLDSDITGAAVGESLIESLESVYAGTSGIFHFATTRANQGSFTVKTTSGYARLINANGSLGSVVAAVGGTITLTIPAAGGHRAYGVISTTSTGVTLGMFEEISLVSKQLTAVSVTSLSFLKQLILDNNYLTEIDATGLGFLNFLHVGDNRLTRFAGTGLSQLDTLLLHNNQIAQFSGAGMGNLTYLGLASNQLVSFSGTGMGSLQSLDLSGNMLANFPSAGLGNLQELNLANNQLAAFSGAGLGLLTILNLANNKLTGFSNTGLGGLTNLNLSDNEIPTFSGVGYANLVVLNLSWNKLIILSSEGLESLKQLDLSGNNLGTFSGAGFGSLTHLILDATKLTSISLAGLPLLKTVSMRQHYFSQAAHDAAFNSLPAAANGNIGYWDSTWDPTDSFLPSAASEAKRTAMTAGGWTLVFGPL